MTLLALLALVASVLVWASPSSQAQANQAPFADAGPDQTLNPGAAVALTGAGSIDVDAGSDGDCGGCEYEWEVETGPYDWIQIGESAETATDDASTVGAYFEVPSEAFVDKVSDSDPQKYEIVVRLKVTDDDGATDSDTVSININQRPVADIQLYAGLRDEDIVDADLGARGHFPDDAVIDGPGENGNRDNEWDVMEGAYLQLDGSASTDENPLTGRPSAYQWTRVRPASVDGYAASQTGPSANPRLDVAAALGDSSNVETITFVGVDADDDDADDTLVVNTLPNVEPNAPQTVFYRLTVCDSRQAATADITDASNCAGRTGAALIRIVVHDTSSAPEVSFDSRTGAVLTTASEARGDAAPQGTVGQITGVENQFIVGAGSTVLLTATVDDDDQPSGTAHNFRWSEATGVPGTATATVRVPADADDGDTIDGSVTVTDHTRTSVTATFQLLVGENTAPTAGGVQANMGSIDNPATGGAVIWVHKVTDGFQNQKDGSTVTLRGVANDADGDSVITAWALREGPDHAALNTAIGTWITAIEAIAPDADAATRASAEAAAAGASLATVGAALQDMQEPDRPLFELEGALTDTVSFDVPNLGNGKHAGTILLFSVIDSDGVAAAQIVYVYVSADDDAPDAKAGADQQVDPEAFVRLNGSDSSDPDVGDEITYKWEYTGATMDPLPDDRSPLSADEIDELDGWILDKADDGTFTYIVNAAGMLTGASDKLKSATTAYPYFDAPDLSGFNNLKLTFRLHVKDSGPTNIDGADAVNTAVASLDEANVGVDLNGDGDTEDTGIAEVKEADLGLDLNNDGDAQDTVNLGTTAANEANVAESDSDTVVITVANRFYTGNIPGPDFCTNRSLGGPQTAAFDSDGDGVADVCSLMSTRREAVAVQNAQETLANLNPVEFRNAVNAVCGAPGFKQANYGDDPADLEADACETGRVTPPPAGVDPAIAETFFSGVITGADFCTNFSLGGARTFANDIDGDDVADQCSLATTRREAIARQNALKTFTESFSAGEQTRHDELAELLELSGVGSPDSEQTARLAELNGEYASGFDADGGTAGSVDDTEVAAVQAEIDRLAAKSAKATRWSNALAAECRALGTQDFGDAASALARDACAPKSGPTGQPLG